MDKVLMEFDYMHEDTVCTHVLVYKGGKVEVTDYIDIIPWRAFGIWGSKAVFDDVISLFEQRCLPKTRENIDELLEGRDFSAKRIIRNVNHGVMACDRSWIRFSDESDLTWSKVSEILKL